MKEKIGFWSLNPASKLESILLSFFFLLLPTQLGKHFWPDFSIVSGIRIDYLSPIIYVTDVVVFLLLVSFLLRQRVFIFSNFKSQKQYLIGGLVILFFVCNIFFANRPLLSLYGFLKLCEFSFVSFYLARTIRLRSQLQSIPTLFAASSIFESLLAIFQYLNQGSLNGIFYYFGERTFTGDTPGIANASIDGTLILRPYATFPHPNVLAGYLLIVIVLVWNFVVKSEKRLLKILGAVSLFVSSVALLLTFSRIAIFLWGVLLVFALGQVVFQKLKTRKKQLIIISVVLLCLVMFGFLPLSHNIFARFAQTSLSDESVVERTELLSVSWKMIQQHSLVGVGIDNFIPALAPLQKPMPLELYLQPVHNIFVLVAAETGFVGFGLFVWLLAATIQRIRNYESGIRNVYFVLLFIIFITGLFDHYWLTLQQGQLLFAMVFGLCWSKSKKST